MSLLEKLNEDLKTAMKEGIASRTAVLRLLLAGLQNERIKLGHELSDAEAEAVLVREGKQRKDSITAFEQANRSDLVDAEKLELEVIQTYLPEQMSEEELGKIIDSVIAEVNAKSAAEMGVVIGQVRQRVGSAADGALIAQLVRQKLS